MGGGSDNVALLAVVFAFEFFIIAVTAGDLHLYSEGFGSGGIPEMPLYLPPQGPCGNLFFGAKFTPRLKFCPEWIPFSHLLFYAYRLITTFF